MLRGVHADRVVAGAAVVSWLVPLYVCGNAHRRSWAVSLWRGRLLRLLAAVGCSLAHPLSWFLLAASFCASAAMSSKPPSAQQKRKLTKKQQEEEDERLAKGQ